MSSGAKHAIFTHRNDQRIAHKKPHVDTVEGVVDQAAAPVIAVAVTERSAAGVDGRGRK